MQDDEGAATAHDFHPHDGGGEAVRGQAAPVGPLGPALHGQVGGASHLGLQVTLPLVLLRMGGTGQVRQWSAD